MTHQIRTALFALLLLFGIIADAQYVTVLPQQKLSKWNIAPANYSGITHISGNTYAVVDDKSEKDGFYLFNIDINPLDGKVMSVSRSALHGPLKPKPNAQLADCEDIVYCPSTNTLFITHEKKGEVVEYTIEGEQTGRLLNIPPYFSRKLQSRYGGFEALAYNQQKQTFWLTTENPLNTDKTLTFGDGRPHQPLRIVEFGNDLQPKAQWAYLMDAPLLKTDNKYYAHGVTAITSLPDGRLLVMERELSIPKNFFGSACEITIYAVTPWANTTLDSDTSLHQLGRNSFLPKQLVANFSTNLGINGLNYANYEGMCLGPKLSDGRQTILLINDSQAGSGNKLYTLKDYIKVIILPANF